MKISLCVNPLFNKCKAIYMFQTDYFQNERIAMLDGHDMAYARTYAVSRKSPSESTNILLVLNHSFQVLWWIFWNIGFALGVLVMKCSLRMENLRSGGYILVEQNVYYNVSFFFGRLVFILIFFWCVLCSQWHLSSVSILTIQTPFLPNILNF